MDGMKSHKNVSVVAATNYPWKLDSAMLINQKNSYFSWNRKNL